MNYMTKSVLILLALLHILSAFGQSDNEIKEKVVTDFHQRFFNLIQKEQYSKAYQYMGVEARMIESEAEFTLYYRKFNKYYGAYKNLKYDWHQNSSRTKPEQESFSSYTIEFEKATATVLTSIRRQGSNKLKIHQIIYYWEEHVEIREFSDMAKDALSYIRSKDYQPLYESARSYPIYRSYEELKEGFENLETGDGNTLIFQTQNISVFKETVTYELKYEVNQKGSILLHFKDVEDSIYLDDLVFLTLDKSDSVIMEEMAQLQELEAKQKPGSKSYVNDTYNFMFQYPDNWTTINLDGHVVVVREPPKEFISVMSTFDVELIETTKLRKYSKLYERKLRESNVFLNFEIVSKTKVEFLEYDALRYHCVAYALDIPVEWELIMFRRGDTVFQLTTTSMLGKYDVLKEDTDNIFQSFKFINKSD